jgi:hypothetical protein
MKEGIAEQGEANTQLIKYENIEEQELMEFIKKRSCVFMHDLFYF